MLAQAYLSAIKEKDRKGKQKTALAVSPTHAEADRITKFIRDALRQDGRLGNERHISTWVPAQLTDAQKSDAANFEPGDLLVFHQNAPGHKIGSRLVVTEGQDLPLSYAQRFEVFRPSQLTLAVNDRIRITKNGWTKDKKQRIDNGDLYTVQRITPQGDLVLDGGKTISRDFGHIAYGYAVTSHAAQGKTVHKVFIGESSQSFGATNQRSFYVPVTRGKEQAVVFTDNKQELLKAVGRPDAPMSATELADSRRSRRPLRERLQKHLAQMRRIANFVLAHELRQSDPERTPPFNREYTHA